MVRAVKTLFRWTNEVNPSSVQENPDGLATENSRLNFLLFAATLSARNTAPRRNGLSSAKALVASIENLKAVAPGYFFNRQNVKS